MVDDQDFPYFFCGTTTGDILVINRESKKSQFFVPDKEKFSQGVTALTFVRIANIEEHTNRDGTKIRLPTFEFLVGAGDGHLGQYKIKMAFKNGKVTATMAHKSDVK